MELHYQIIAILLFQLVLLIGLFVYVLIEIRSIKNKMNPKIKASTLIRASDIVTTYTHKNTNLS